MHNNKKNLKSPKLRANLKREAEKNIKHAKPNTCTKTIKELFS